MQNDRVSLPVLCNVGIGLASDGCDWCATVSRLATIDSACSQHVLLSAEAGLIVTFGAHNQRR